MQPGTPKLAFCGHSVRMPCLAHSLEQGAAAPVGAVGIKARPDPWGFVCGPISKRSLQKHPCMWGVGMQKDHAATKLLR
jgi:hypothetical protein